MQEVCLKVWSFVLVPSALIVYENTNGSPLTAVNATAHANVNV
jgi:hypothetical protein